MTKEFWKAATIRMLHTIAQAAIAAIGSAALLSEVDWLSVLSIAALAGFVSLLKSIMIGLPEVNGYGGEDD